MVGACPRSRRTSSSRQCTPIESPVPSALSVASLAAKRAAKCWIGSRRRRQYPISSSVNTRRRNRSSHRAITWRMRVISARSTPMPLTSLTAAPPAGGGADAEGRGASARSPADRGADHARDLGGHVLDVRLVLALEHDAGERLGPRVSEQDAPGAV